MQNELKVKPGVWLRDVVNNTVFRFNNQPYCAGGVEFWRPKKSEYCWSSVYGLIRTVSCDEYGNCKVVLVFNVDGLIKYCHYLLLEPFIGELPSFINHTNKRIKR